jgi:hypothetical protein
VHDLISTVPHPMSAETAVLVGRGIAAFCALMVIVCAIVIVLAAKRQLWVIVASMSISTLAMTISGVSAAVSANTLARLIG